MTRSRAGDTRGYYRVMFDRDAPAVSSGGPLAGVRVVELAGLGPAPFAAMMLADMGANVVRIDRPGTSVLKGMVPDAFEYLNRGKRSVVIDLKQPEGMDLASRLIDWADVLLEGFRPGVMERLGLGPEACCARNPRLVYGRMTGWGQHGPLSHRAGHDIAYVALTGALHAMGPRGGAPAIPLNLVGDFGGGAMYLLVGVLAALVEREHSGRGQVIDAAIVDGTASMLTHVCGLIASGLWSHERGTNLLDGGTPWYAVYETADGRHVAVGAIEPKFYETFLSLAGLSEEPLPDQWDRDGWPILRARFGEVLRQRTRDEWAAIFADSDACVAPVLTVEEAAAHPHLAARGTFIQTDGHVQPSPAPRFSRTAARRPVPLCTAGRHTREVLQELGVTGVEVEALEAGHVVETA